MKISPAAALPHLQGAVPRDNDGPRAWLRIPAEWPWYAAAQSDYQDRINM